MQLLTVEGDELERSLAISCLDLVATITRELRVFRELQAIYSHVAAAGPDSSPEQPSPVGAIRQPATAEQAHT